MRINKFLAECGVCSRRGADKLISEGRVKVNAKKVTTLGMDISEENDTVLVDDNKVELVNNFTYILFNKPKGCVCTVKDDRGRKTIMDYINCGEKRIFPVGRLDYDSEGMLILTNDGDLAFRLTHPKNEITKTYQVRFEGTINETELRELRNGVMIDDVKTNHASIKVLEVVDKVTKLEVTISEGRNHHIKKMFDTVGKNIIFIKRVAIGDMRLGGMGRGTFRNLTDEEVYYLKNL